MIEIIFPIRRMDWVEDREALEKLTYKQAIDDLMSALDIPHDCIYTVGEMIDVLSRHWNMSGSKLLGAATFGLADLQDEKEGIEND